MYVQDEETVNIYLSVHAIKANWLDWYGDCCLNKDVRKFKVSFYVAGRYELYLITIIP